MHSSRKTKLLQCLWEHGSDSDMQVAHHVWEPMQEEALSHSTATISNNSRSGKLKKRGAGFPYRWQERFFVVDLQNHIVSYYTSEKAARSKQMPKGSFKLTKVVHGDQATELHKAAGFPMLVEGDVQFLTDALRPPVYPSASMEENMPDEPLVNASVNQPKLSHYDVVVIGCGTTGLMLANELGKHDVHCCVLDMRKDTITDTRAFMVNCRSMELLTRLGLATKYVEEGMPPELGNGSVLMLKCLVQGEKFADVSAPCRNVAQQEGPGDRAASMCASNQAAQQPQRIMQCKQEAVLRKAAEALPTVDVLYGWKAVSFEVEQEMVKVKIEQVPEDHVSTIEQHSARQMQLTCSYLVGCDGPVGIVRRQLGLSINGILGLGQARSIRIQAPDLYAAVREHVGERHQYFVVDEMLGMSLCVPNDVDEGIWSMHWVWVNPALGKSVHEISQEELRGYIRQFIGGDSIPFEIIGDGCWHMNLYVLNKFRQGRVMVAGDAAHSWPPFGGLGANTGYADAVNLGWKLAALLKGWSGEALLESYEDERIAAVERTATFVVELAGVLGPPASAALFSDLFSGDEQRLEDARATWVKNGSEKCATNHFASEGVQLDGYLSSHVCCYTAQWPKEEHHALISYEHLPSTHAGFRVPHVPLEEDGLPSIHSRLSATKFTLVVCAPQDSNSLQQVEGYPTQAPATSQVQGETCMVSDVLNATIDDFRASFAAHGANLDIFDATKKLVDTPITPLYHKTPLLLVRPDHIIAWSFCPHAATVQAGLIPKTTAASIISSRQEQGDELSTARIEQVVKRVLGFARGSTCSEDLLSSAQAQNAFSSIDDAFKSKLEELQKKMEAAKGKGKGAGKKGSGAATQRCSQVAIDQPRSFAIEELKRN